MHFDIQSLECFVAVAETKSFTKAARRALRTQSAVSQQVAKLEEQIERPLFVRGKTFALTSDGELLLSYAKQILKLSREAYDKFKQPDLKGEVRFGVPEDFASVFLSDVLLEFSSLHPLVHLHVECDLTLNLFDRFKSGELDLVLLKMNRPEDFPNGIDVWSEPLEWVGDPQHMRKDTEQIPLVLAPSPCVYRSRALTSLERSQRNWRIVFSSPSYAGMIAAVKAGMGVTVLPKNMVPKELNILKRDSDIPALDNTHISLVKHTSDNYAINSFEKFVMQQLRM